MIKIKTDEEINKIRESCRIAYKILNELGNNIKSGITTTKIELFADKLFEEYDCRPAFKGYNGYPSSVCISPNDIIVHGIPDDYVLKEGDIISIDVGVEKNGYYGDVATTFAVGHISGNAVKLIETAEIAFQKCLEYAVVGKRLYDISHAIQQYVETKGYSVVRDFVGHGIGSELHEDPAIPNYGNPNTGPVLKEGMIFAIEPMVNQGDYRIKMDKDKWTARTKDGSLAAHYERTILITKGKPEILTN